MMPPETIEPAELAMAGLALIALILTSLNYRSAVSDRAASREQRINGAVAMWANHAIWTEIMSVTGSALLLGIAAVLLALPPLAPTLTILWWWNGVELALTGRTAMSLVAALHEYETRRVLRESLDPGPGWDGIDRRMRQVPPPIQEGS